MTKVRPLEKKVLVQLTQEVEKTKKGIIVLASNDSFCERAIVIEIGHLVKHVRINDRVLINKYKGQMFQIDDKEFIIVDEEDIFAILEE
jgi:chaperonin GroES